MKNYTRGSAPALFLTLITAIVTAFSGCGNGHDGMGFGDSDAPETLASGIQSLDNRLESHYASVTHVLNSADSRDGAMQGVRTGAYFAVGSSGPTNEDWQRIRLETEDYSQDMHRVLNDLGERVTVIGSCRMMMEGMAFGFEDTGITCPCEPYMNISTEELERHLEDMLAWMDAADARGVWEEMEKHRRVMRSSIQEMGAHMQQVYGAQREHRMGMM